MWLIQSRIFLSYLCCWIWLNLALVASQCGVVVALPKYICQHAETTISLHVPLSCSTAGGELTFMAILTVSGQSSVAERNVIKIKPGEPAVWTFSTLLSGSPYRLHLTSDAIKYEKNIDLVGKSCTVIELQVDKAMYKPGDTVLARIIALNNTMYISNDPIRLELQNPHGLVFASTSVQPTDQQFRHARFYLPRTIPERMLGVWKIVAYSTQSVNTTIAALVSFPVNQYKLPKFKLTAMADKQYLKPENTQINLTIGAWYPFGKPVNGPVNVYVRGAHNIEMKNYISSGSLHVIMNLLEEHLRTQSTVEIVVTAKDAAFGEEANTTIRLPVATANSYKLKPRFLKPFLRPNVAFEVMTSLGYDNATPALDVSIKASMTLISLWKPIVNNITLQGVTGQDGKVIFMTTIPEHFSMAVIELSVVDEFDMKNIQSALLSTGLGRTASMISLSTEKYTYSVGEDAKFSVAFYRFLTQPPVYMSLTCRGIVLSHKKLESIEFTVHIVAQMAPSCTIVLYTDTGKDQTFDALYFNVVPSCEPLTVTTDGVEAAPKQLMQFTLTGRANTLAGLTATDSRIVVTEDDVQQIPVDRRFYYNYLDFNPTKLTTLDGSVLGVIMPDEQFIEDCCEVARVWKQVQDTRCTWKFAENHSPSIDKCVAEINKCCQESLDPDSLPFGHEGSEIKVTFTPLGNPISGNNPVPSLPQLDTLHEEVDAKAPETVRSFFPETWFFEDLSLGTDGAASKKFKTPDALTTWIVKTRYLLPGEGLCNAQLLNVVVKKGVFIVLDSPEFVYRTEQVEIAVTIFNLNDAFQSLYVCQEMTDVEKSKVCAATGGIDTPIDITLEPLSNVTLRIPMEFTSLGIVNLTFHILMANHVVNSKNCAESPYKLDSVRRSVLVQERIDFETESVRFLIDPTQTLTRFDNSSENTIIEGTVGGYNISFRQPRSFAMLSITGHLLTPDKLLNLMHFDTMLGVNSRSIPELLTTGFALSSYQQYLTVLHPGDDSFIHNPEINEPIEKIIAQLLSYRTNPGSYQRQVNKNSLWFTILATELLCMNQVDSEVVCPSIQWIASRINRNEGFYSFPEDLDIMQMNDENEQKQVLSAMVLIMLSDCSSTLASCGPMAQDILIKQRLTSSYVKRLPLRGTYASTYSALYGSYALSLAPDSVSLATASNRDTIVPAFAKDFRGLYIPYKTDDSGNSVWISLWDKISTPFTRRKSNPLTQQRNIEMTALGLLVQLKLKARTVSIVDIVSWLVGQKQSSGLYAGVQDTWLAYRALQEFSSTLITESNEQLSVSVECSTCSLTKQHQTIVVDRTNMHSIQTVLLDAPTGDVRLTASGSGTVEVILTSELGKPSVPRLQSKDDPPPPIDVHLAVTQIPGDPSTFPATACINVSPEFAGKFSQVLLKIRLFSGCHANEDNFTHSGGCTVDYTEATGNTYLVQLSEVAANQDYCVNFLIKQRIIVTPIGPALIEVYYPEFLSEPIARQIVNHPDEYNQLTNLGLLQKYCDNVTGQCYCTETLCPKCTTCTSDFDSASRWNATKVQSQLCSKNDSFASLVWIREVISTVEQPDYTVLYGAEQLTIKQGLSINSDECCTACNLRLVTKSKCMGEQLSCSNIRGHQLYLLIGSTTRLRTVSGQQRYFLTADDYFEQWLDCDNVQEALREQSILRLKERWSSGNAC